MPSVRGFDFPPDLLYLLEQDTWVRLDADGLATVGITPLGAYISGEFMEFMAKPVGSEIERDRSLGALEMSKVVRSARSPLSGTIVEVNAAVRADPTLINRDPYGTGWLVRLLPRAWAAEAPLLVTGEAIEAAAENYMSLLAETFDQEKPAR